MTEEKFSFLTKWGGLVLVLCAFSNIYLVLRYREVYRDASKMEQTYPQQLAVYNVEVHALEGVIRDFASRANADSGIADILRRHNLPPTNGPVKTAAPARKP